MSRVSDLPLLVAEYACHGLFKVDTGDKKFLSVGGDHWWSITDDGRRVSSEGKQAAELVVPCGCGLFRFDVLRGGLPRVTPVYCLELEECRVHKGDCHLLLIFDSVEGRVRRVDGQRGGVCSVSTLSV